MSKPGPLNRHSLIALLEASVEAIDDVVATGESLKTLSRVQGMLRDAVLWLDPERVDRMVDSR